MREPLLFKIVFKIEFRITPAHAGTTYGENSFSADLEDHPRSCGNHSIVDG